LAKKGQKRRFHKKLGLNPRYPHPAGQIGFWKDREVALRYART
jgi:hypothetical protein